MITSTLVVERRADGVFNNVEQQALIEFLGGYSGLTRDAYALDLRQFASGCEHRRLALFDVARHDIEGFALHLEDLGRGRATISRRLCTITSLYRYAVEEGLLDRSPAVHVRRPRLDYESNATGLDRNEVGAVLVSAGRAWCERERGHRTLLVHRRSRRRPRPVATDEDRSVGQRLDRHGASRIVRRIARQSGITKRVGPHTLRHAFITAALDAGVPLRDVQEAASHADPRTTMRYDRARVSLDRHATYVVSTFIAGASR